MILCLSCDARLSCDCLQAEDVDVSNLKKDPKFAAMSAECPVPERFYKLPRIKFLMLLCSEVARMNQVVTKQLEVGHTCLG